MNLCGGPVLWVLAAMAAAAVFMFLERFAELRRAQTDWQDFLNGVLNVLASGNEQEALAICEDVPVPVANVTAAAIRSRKGPPDALVAAVDAQGRVETGRLDRRLASLSAIGQTAPLVGLFGTIVGFVRTVLVLNGDEPVLRQELVSAAVPAMVQAAAGLAVAAIAAVMYASLRARADRIVAELEAAATELVSRLRDGREAK